MKTNTQAPEKSIILAGGSLEVHSLFYTIQGEGPFVGRPAIFIRLAGCNLQCPACDTAYTENRQTFTPAELMFRLHQECWQVGIEDKFKPLIVITGGEPFRQELGPFCALLMKYAFPVQIETNGTLYNKVPDQVVIVCSPKTGSLNKHLAERANAFKYVIDPDSVDDNDGLPIKVLGHSAHPKVARPPASFKGTIYVQPIDTGWDFVNKKNEQAVVAIALKHGYTLCLQVHKIINLA